MDQAKFYQKQISLTEWLEAMGHSSSVILRKEDLEKYERLEVLHQTIGLPYGRPRKFAAATVLHPDAEFLSYLSKNADDLCMIRLAPKNPANPKLRMRGKTVSQAVEWFKEQTVDPSEYDVYFVPHTEDHGWATIFVVNQHGVAGEAIKGQHNLLTQGLYENGESPVTFSFDFQDWQFSRIDPDAEKYLKQLVPGIRVADETNRQQLADRLGSKFAHDFLTGYFETTNSESQGTWFLDYSPALGELYQDYAAPARKSEPKSLLHGQVGSPGRAEGKVRIVQPEDIGTARLENGEILVCHMTTPDYLPLMKQAAAIVTDLGGILSHAAIVARELGKPCLTATGTATSVLHDGQLVEVDADSGEVKSLNLR